MSDTYQLGFIILRANPLTKAHIKLLENALLKCDHVIVFIGSSNSPLCEQTPFPCSLRKEMIEAKFGILETMTIEYLDDYHDNEEWSRAVKGKVNRVKNKIFNITGKHVYLTMFGGKKPNDKSTYYFKLFPESFCSQNIILSDEQSATSATDIREALYTNKEVVEVPISTRKGPFWLKKIPYHHLFFKYFSHKESYKLVKYQLTDLIEESTLKIIRNFEKTEDWQLILEERSFNKKYSLRVQYPVLDFLRYLEEQGEDISSLKIKAEAYYRKHRPYEVQGNATDNVVRQNNQYLLVKRKGYPYKGKWALPGGIVESTETRFASALRELKEETGIMMHKDELAKCLIGEMDVENPNRDPRLRMFSKAFIFELPDNKENLLKAGSDAEDCIWKTYEEILEIKHDISFDHLAIIREAERIRAKKPLLEF